MTPSASATPAKPRTPKAHTAPSAPPEPGAADTPTVPPASILEADGSYSFIYTIDPNTVRRLLTRTFRPDKDQMIASLPRYVEQIVKRAIETEVW